MKNPKRIARTVQKENLSQRLRWDDNLEPCKQKQVINKARNLYLQDYPYSTIYLLTGIPFKIVYLRRRGWDKLKAKVDKQIIENIRKDAISEKAEKFVYMGLDLGLKFLDRCIKKGTDFDARDFKLVMDSVMAIHRVKQLETGQATDISKELNSLSPEQLKEYLISLKEEAIRDHGEVLTFERLSHEQVLDAISEEDGEH